MSIERQILFWGLLFAAVGYALHVLGSTVTPFAAGIALGYLLDPVVCKLEKLGLNRLGAALVILVVFGSAVAAILIFVVPILSSQLVTFAQRLPSYAVRLQALAVEEGNALIARYGGGWIKALGFGEQLSSAEIQKSIGDFVARGAQWFINAMRSLVSGGAAVFDFFSLLVITPVVAFYILVDWDRMVAEIDSWLPIDHRKTLRAIAWEINQALAGFIRGQSLVCLCLGLWYGGRPDAGRARFRPPDRLYRRNVELHPLCRVAHRSPFFDCRRSGSGLAASEICCSWRWRSW